MFYRRLLIVAFLLSLVNFTGCDADRRSQTLLHLLTHTASFPPTHHGVTMFIIHLFDGPFRLSPLTEERIPAVELNYWPPRSYSLASKTDVIL